MTAVPSLGVLAVLRLLKRYPMTAAAPEHNNVWIKERNLSVNVELLGLILKSKNPMLNFQLFMEYLAELQRVYNLGSLRLGQMRGACVQCRREIFPLNKAHYCVKYHLGCDQNKCSGRCCTDWPARHRKLVMTNNSFVCGSCCLRTHADCKALRTELYVKSRALPIMRVEKRSHE